MAENYVTLLSSQTVSSSTNSSTYFIKDANTVAFRISVSSGSSFDCQAVIQTSMFASPGSTDWDDLTESDTTIDSDANYAIDIKDVDEHRAVRVKLTLAAGSATVSIIATADGGSLG